MRVPLLMPSSFRDPKTLADWIQLDYFRQPGRFWRIRNVLTLLVLIICLFLLMPTWRPEARFVYQSRPVSDAHAMFNDRCSICHVESFQPALRLLRGDSSLRSVPDATCQECHAVGPHQACVNEPNCSTCHKEHRGRTVLARVPDTQCTACHADLTAVCPAQDRFAARLSSFNSDHPRFGHWRKEGLSDPGTVRFNHKVHLNLKPESVRGIDAPLAALNEQQCNYCHKPDAARRYMEPVNYEQHCRQCHALSVRVAGDWADDKASAAAERFASEPAPHKEPMTVRAALRERFTRFVQENPSALVRSEPIEPPRWIPQEPRAQPMTDKEGTWISEQLQTAERMLFYGPNGCRYCHKMDKARGSGDLPEYASSNLTASWFPYSVFSHERHRMLRCTECHEAPSSRDAKDVLVPTIDLCRQCHNSKQGARTDCAECHRYHDRGKEVFRGDKTIRECITKR
jgi:predicted CXXCH cytochrome family protein